MIRNAVEAGQESRLNGVGKNVVIDHGWLARLSDTYKEAILFQKFNVFMWSLSLPFYASFSHFFKENVELFKKEVDYLKRNEKQEMLQNGRKEEELLPKAGDVAHYWSIWST